MPNNTLNQQVPYPTLTDPADGPGSSGNIGMQDLAEALERLTVMRFASIADRTARLIGPVEGMVSHLADLNRFDSYDGADWIPLFPTRVATDPRDTASGTFTAETVVQSITASLIAGRTYRVTYRGTLQSSVANDSARSRLREDSIAGTQMQNYRVACPNTNAGFSADVEAEFTAGATGSKTFVVTGERATGTGLITASAAATSKAYLYVDFIR